MQVLATVRPAHFPPDARRNRTQIDFAIYKGISSNFLTVPELNELSSNHIPLEILLCAAVSPRLTTKSLLLIGLKLDVLRII